MLMKTCRTALLAGTLTVMGGFVAHAQEVYEATPELIEAATAEGAVVFYTATDVQVAERVARSFEAEYPGIRVQVERAGAERIFQRVMQEYSVNIHNADVIETSDAVHFEIFKREGWLSQDVPDHVARFWPEDARDPDGHFAAYRAHLSVIGYNTNLVTGDDIPTSHADLLDPKWQNRIVKAHPGYSGTVMTGTFALSKVLGWEFFEKLAQQNIMQVQSSTEPPKRLAVGERAIMADGNEYNLFQLKEDGVPIDVVYAEEGTPIAIGNAGLLANAKNPNAAKLFYHYIFSKDAQQLLSDEGGLRSFHPDVVEKDTRTPLSEIKILYSDAAEMEGEIIEIKQNYERLFGT